MVKLAPPTVSSVIKRYHRKTFYYTPPTFAAFFPIPPFFPFLPRGNLREKIHPFSTKTCKAVTSDSDDETLSDHEAEERSLLQ